MAKKKVIKQKQKQKQTVIVNINTKKTSRASSKKPRSAPVSAPVPISYQYLPRTVYYGDAATTSAPISAPVKPEVKPPIRIIPPLPAGPPPIRIIPPLPAGPPPIRTPLPDIKRDYPELQMPEPIKQEEVGALRMPFKFPEVGFGYDPESDAGYLTEAVARPIRAKKPNRPKEVVAEEKRQKAERARMRAEEKASKKMSQV